MAKFLFKKICIVNFSHFWRYAACISSHLLPAIRSGQGSSGPSATNEQVEAKRAELGLDKPIYVQYLNYMKGLLKLDMGTSFKTKQPVAQEISSSFLPLWN